MNRKYLVISIAGLIIVGLLLVTVVYRNAKKPPPAPSEVAAIALAESASGSEIAGLTNSEPKPPIEGEIVAVDCKPGATLRAGEFIVGLPGVFLKVSPDGSIKQTSGEELVGVKSAVDPTRKDFALELKVECAEDTEESKPAAQILYVSNLNDEQIFSTQKGIAFETNLTADDQKFFETQVDTRCLKIAGQEPQAPRSATCTHPELFAVTDLNEDGKKEYWFREPSQWDFVIGVTDVNGHQILRVCPSCGVNP